MLKKSLKVEMFENIWSLIYSGTTPDAWHYEASDIWQNNYSKFFAIQKPQEFWTHFESEKLDLLHISNNETNAVIRMETGMNDAMDFLLNVYNN